MSQVRPFKISEETRAKLSRLTHAKPSLWESISGKSASGLRDLFEEIAAADELAAVPSLANFLADGKGTSAAAKSAIRKIIKGRSPDELRRLDEICRQFSTYSSSYWPWAQIKPSQVSRVATHDDVHILGLLSFHPSGWVRSESLKRLDRSESGEELVYLIVRANDWVDPVRQQAWKAIQRRLIPDYADAFARNMGIVVALESKTRTSMDGLLADIHDYLLSHPNALTNAVGHPDFRSRRAAFRTAYKLDEEKRTEFIKLALRDSDSPIRLVAARQAAQLSDVNLRKEFMQTMLFDRWHAVRTQALHMAVCDADDSTKDILLSLLLDKSKTVRSAARYYLREYGVEGFRNIYVDALNDEYEAVAILGLGECGVAEDVQAIQPYLESANPKILSAAVTAISRLMPNDSDGMLLDNLAHPHKAPSNAAARQLRDRVTSQTQTRIAQTYEDGSLPFHARFNALKLLGAAGKWDMLIYWLRGLADDEPKIAEHCERGLRRWQHAFNRSFTEPSEPQVQEIRKLMTQQLIAQQSIAPFLHNVMRSY